MRKVCLTCDLWLAVTNDHYFVVTCHWINDNWQIRNLILDFVDVHSKQDSKAIFEFLNKTISRFNLHRKLLAIATDNASTMVAVMNKLITFMKNNYQIDIYHIRCAAHILNLIVGILYNSVLMKNSILAVRNAIKDVRGSSKLEYKLKQYAHVNEEPDIKLILDCEIRWNSTFDMLQVALKLRKSLTELASNEISMDSIEDDDWKNVGIVVELLEPFKLATEEICGDDYVLMSRLYPVFIGIKDHLIDCEKKKKYDPYKSVVQEMIMKYTEYWLIIRPFAIIANGLDPRFKIDIMPRGDKEFFTTKLSEIFNTENNSNSSSVSSSPASSQDKNKISITKQVMIQKNCIQIQQMK